MKQSFEVVKLSDVCNSETSNLTLKNLENNFGEYSLYGASGFIKNIDFYKQDKDYIGIVKDGAGIGRVMLLEKYSSILGTMQYIIPKENINIKYLYYNLIKMNLSKYFTGSTIPHIYFKDYKKEKVFLRTLPEQEKISIILDKVSKILEMKKQQFLGLDSLVKFQFLEIFGDPILNEKNWKTEKLENIYKIIDGDRGKNYPKQNEFYKNEFCLFLNAKNVTNFGFNFDKVEFITKEKDEILRSGKLERGDIVVTTRGTIGNTAYYDNNITFENIRINSGMVILREKEKMNPIFFIKYFQNFRIYNKVVSGTAQPQIPITNMKNLKIIVPPIELQNKFADFVKQVDKSKVILGKALKSLSFRLNYYYML